jgi:hypothetical protein
MLVKLHRRLLVSSTTALPHTPDNGHPPDPLVDAFIGHHGVLAERGGGILHAHDNVTRCGGVEFWNVHRGILILGRREWVSVVECGRCGEGGVRKWHNMGTNRNMLLEFRLHSMIETQ